MTNITETETEEHEGEHSGDHIVTHSRNPYLVDRRKWLNRFRDAGPHVHEFALCMMILSSYTNEKGRGQCPSASEFGEHVNLSEDLAAHYLSLGTRYGWVRRVMPDDLRKPFRFRLTTPAPGYLKETWAEW